MTLSENVSKPRPYRSFGLKALVVILASLSACSDTAPTPASPPSQNSGWSLNGGNYSGDHFSPLQQITRSNVQSVGMAWAYDGYTVRGRTHRANEATPLVVGRTLYTTGPWSTVHALDAATGAEKWSYDPEIDGQWIRKTCCDAVNRGPAYADGVVYVGTLDGYLDALDAATGKRLWRADTLVDRTRAYSITGAPQIAGDVILIGNGGAEMGVRGYVTAYDLKTGAEKWRFFTVPGAPNDADTPAMAKARETWSPNSRWDIGGGGTVWDSMAYDPELNLAYIGVGNGSPWPVWLRSPGGGDNLYLSSIVALDASTGDYVWHYQTTPADSWDYTATQNMILTDMTVDGKNRKVIMQAPKNGFYYVIDRKTGELLSANNYTKVTWASHIDIKTGRPAFTENADYSKGKKTIWPATAGGHNWQPMAYNPQTALTYIPVLELAMTFGMEETLTYQADTALVGAKASPPRPGTPAAADMFKSVLTAWDPQTQKMVWKSEPRPWWSGGVLTTAGDLVVEGHADGMLAFYDASSGDLLKEIPTGVGILGAPISYQIDGTQYIAVSTGFGGGIKRYLPGLAALTYENIPRLLVFKLGGTEVPLPAKLEAAPLNPIPDFTDYTATDAQAGQAVFMKNCGKCHAFRGAENGYPNLWNMPDHTFEAFDQIVLDGAYSYAGMPRFDDILTETDTKALKAFLVSDTKQQRNQDK